MSAPTVEYLPDLAVDETLDRDLRDLLGSCFTKPGGEIFRERRYWHELPEHRWFIRAPTGELIAHVAVHEKVVIAGDDKHRIGGIAEVCVRPEHRGHGYVKVMLARVHEWLRHRGFDYAVLFGDPRVYGSSGYVGVQNLVRDVPDSTGRLCRHRADGAMIALLSGQPWPTVEVFLPGEIF